MTTPPPELDRLVRALDARKNGAGWKALCPCHADENPSLSIRLLDGRIVVNCFGGCDNATVRAELRRRGLLPDPDRDGDIEATYDYRDAQGVLLFQVVRKKGKQFRQRRPDGKGGWVWKLDGVTRVLYRLPELLKADSAEDVYIPEGEKDVDRLRSLGLVATTNSGGAGKWQRSYSEALRGRHVVVLPDNDQAGRDHARDVCASLRGVAASVKVVPLGGPDKGDVSDWLAGGGSRLMLESLARQANPVGPEPEGKEAAPEGRPATPETPVVAPEDGGALLDDLASALGDYVAFPSPEAQDACALWVAHTHALDAFESTPRLALISAEKQSGKTRTLEVTELLAHAPKHAANLSPAALFRLVAAGPLTLLFDEADAYFGPRAKEHEELRALINAGHRRGAQAYRCVGEGSKQQVVPFPAFAPVALAAIGGLPDTVVDRSIVVAMRRRLPSQPVTPFRRREALARLTPLRGRLEAWAKARLQELEAGRPEMPEGISDRPADVWEPLLAVADVAGGHWPARAREAAVALDSERRKADASVGVQLLADVRTVFTAKEVDRLTTARLLEGLTGNEEWPWGALPRTGKPLDATGLARRLKPFDVKPATVRFGAGPKDTAKGYELAWFADAFARYLPPPSSPENPSQASQASQPGGSPVTGDPPCDASQPSHAPEPSQPHQEHCDGVTGVTASGGREETPPRTRVVNRKHGERYDVDIGRPGRWGNPFGRPGTGAVVIVADDAEAVACHDAWLGGDTRWDDRIDPAERAWRLEHVADLAGKTLGCYCAREGGLFATDRPHKCHGQTLAELADRAGAGLEGTCRYGHQAADVDDWGQRRCADPECPDAADGLWPTDLAAAVAAEGGA